MSPLPYLREYRRLQGLRWESFHFEANLASFKGCILSSPPETPTHC